MITFYSGEEELTLAHLTSARQGRDESVADFIRRFKDIRNRCFDISVIERDLVGLAMAGLQSYIREKLENQSIFTLAQLLQKATVHEHRGEES